MGHHSCTLMMNVHRQLSVQGCRNDGRDQHMMLNGRTATSFRTAHTCIYKLMPHRKRPGQVVALLSRWRCSNSCSKDSAWLSFSTAQPKNTLLRNACMIVQVQTCALYHYHMLVPCTMRDLYHVPCCMHARCRSRQAGRQAGRQQPTRTSVDVQGFRHQQSSWATPPVLDGI